MYEVAVPDDALTEEDEDILNYDDIDDPDAFASVSYTHLRSCCPPTPRRNLQTALSSGTAWSKSRKQDVYKRQSGLRT